MPKRHIRSAESWTYVLLADRALPVAEQSRFTLRPLTQGEKLAVLDGLNWVEQRPDGSQGVHPRAFVQARELVRDHLEGTENFPTDGPRTWPVNGGQEEKERYLEMLSEFDLLELGNEIRYQASPSVRKPEVVGATAAAGSADAGGPGVPNS